MSAMAEIAQQLDRQRRAADLSLAAMAARGDSADIKKMIREWSQ
jgi:hypothetical protein